MTEVLGALLLGMVQGITEFAPVSSTAHLALIPWLFQWQSPLLSSLTFDVALHLGTLVATLGYFSREWGRLAQAGIASLRERTIAEDPWRRMAWLLLLATIPGVLAGVLLERQAETAFRSPLLMAVTMILLGMVLALGERWGSKRHGLMEVTPAAAFWIGIGQAVAIVPGVSRSGGTMAAALFVGLNREAAARFSFLLATPIIAGAGLKKMGDLLTLSTVEGGGLALPVGFLASAVVGYLCIKYLLRYLQNGTLYVFAWYRLITGALVLVVFFQRGG